jgi:hypothetical protein
MKILNKDDIENYLKGFARRDEVLSSLLMLTLRVPLERERSCLQEVKNVSEISNQHLHKKFNQKSHPWYRFVPYPTLAEDVKRVCQWIENFLEAEGHHFNGALKEKTKDRLRSLKTLQQAIDATYGSLLTQAEIHDALSERVILNEEKKGHINHIQALSNRYHLFRITTTTGMDSAGKRANNCLWKSDAPDNILPHRNRVNWPERWQYFSVRDPNNKPVITICIDIQRAHIQWEPDDIRTQVRAIVELPAHLQILLDESIAKIKELHPVFKNPNVRIELYDEPTIPHQNINRYQF